MNNRELELISIIRNSTDPALALQTAISIITDFLQQHESSEG